MIKYKVETIYRRKDDGAVKKEINNYLWNDKVKLHIYMDELIKKYNSISDNDYFIEKYNVIDVELINPEILIGDCKNNGLEYEEFAVIVGGKDIEQWFNDNFNGDSIKITVERIVD